MYGYGRSFIEDGNGYTRAISAMNCTNRHNWFGTDDPAERQKKYVEYLKK